MRIVKAADTLSWKIEERKEGNKHTTLICYRKYLDEALAVADESKNSIKLYYEVLKHFKEQISAYVKTTSTGEYVLKYNNDNCWFHRDKNRVMQSFYEFTLKRVCLKNGINFIDGLQKVFSMNSDDILKVQKISE